MDLLSRAMSMIRNLPDPLIYSIIAVVASGAVYSTIHHIGNSRPRKIKRVKLKGPEGKKVEDCTLSNFHFEGELANIHSTYVMEPWNSGSEYKFQRRLRVDVLLLIGIDR
jgi:hypothetical protein